MNITQSLHESARQRPEQAAVTFEGEAWTYAAFSRQVERYAGALQALGVRTGDRVALQMPKCMEFLFLHFAALSLGAVSLPLNSDYQPDEVRYFLTDSQSALFITDRERCRRARARLGEIAGLRVHLVDGGPDDPAGLGRALAQAASRGAPEPFAARGGETAMICYTSGTTGRSKGAMITHENLISFPAVGDGSPGRLAP